MSLVEFGLYRALNIFCKQIHKEVNMDLPTCTYHKGNYFFTLVIRAVTKIVRGGGRRQMCWALPHPQDKPNTSRKSCTTWKEFFEYWEDYLQSYPLVYGVPAPQVLCSQRPRTLTNWSPPSGIMAFSNSSTGKRPQSKHCTRHFNMNAHHLLPLRIDDFLPLQSMH